jgi:hypothetical protein
MHSLKKRQRAEHQRRHWNTVIMTDDGRKTSLS